MEGEGYAVQHSEGTHRVVAKAVLGRHWPLHASAGGKALLAWCPGDQERRLLRKPLKRYTSTTIASLPALHRELRQIRQRGYATVRGEYMDDVWGVAAPIFNHRNELEGALTLGGPRSRVTRAALPELGQPHRGDRGRVARAGYQGRTADDDRRFRAGRAGVEVSDADGAAALEGNARSAPAGKAPSSNVQLYRDATVRRCARFSISAQSCVGLPVPVSGLEGVMRLLASLTLTLAVLRATEAVPIVLRAQKPATRNVRLGDIRGSTPRSHCSRRRRSRSGSSS
jgi:hypothetical protein